MVVGVFGLGFEIAKTNFKLKNRGNYLGILWYLLDPLLLFLILLFLRRVIVSTDIEFYPVYLFIGLIMFNFFNKSTLGSSNSITSNSAFIKSMNLPKESFVISRILEVSLSHLFEFFILLVMLIYFDLNYLFLAFYLFIFIFFFIFVLGISFLLASIGVFVSDIRNVWSVITRLLWFLTPIFYSIDNFSLARTLNSLNPLFYFIELQRDILIKGYFNWNFILIGILFSIISFVLGLIVFEYNKYKFAEEV